MEVTEAQSKFEMTEISIKTLQLTAQIVLRGRLVVGEKMNGGWQSAPGDNSFFQDHILSKGRRRLCV